MEKDALWTATFFMSLREYLRKYKLGDLKNVETGKPFVTIEIHKYIIEASSGMADLVVEKFNTKHIVPSKEIIIRLIDMTSTLDDK